MPLENEVKVFQFMHGYGEGLLNDFDPGLAFKLTCDGGVHPAWIIGHLAFVGNRVATMLGGDAQLDMEAWKPLFGVGSTPGTDAKPYPDWDELLTAWRTSDERLVELAPTASAELLARPNPNPRMLEALPSMHDFLSFVLTAHPTMHLGQLSTWRRVQGHPPLF